ncbi:unnamed protein product, partial [Brassica oleracea var. botrytis]
VKRKNIKKQKVGYLRIRTLEEEVICLQPTHQTMTNKRIQGRRNGDRSAVIGICKSFRPFFRSEQCRYRDLQVFDRRWRCRRSVQNPHSIKYNVTVQGLKYNGKKKQPQGKKRWYFSSRKRRDSEQHGCLKVKRGGDLKKRRGLLSGLSLVTRTEKPSFVEDEGGIVLISNNLSSSSFSSRYGCYSLILF